jgi:hypothetical protein
MSNGGGPEPETVREIGGTVGDRRLLDEAVPWEIVVAGMMARGGPPPSVGKRS